MVRDEAAVSACSVPKTLVQHAAEHCPEAVRILVCMLLHLLYRGGHAHLTTGNVDNGIDEIQVGQLAVGAVIDYVDSLEVLLLGVVDGDGALEGS